MSAITTISENKTTSDSNDFCEICIHAKQTRDVFFSNDKASDSFDLIDCDIWDPYPVFTSSGAHYFLTIVDDYSRAVWVYLIS